MFPRRDFQASAHIKRPILERSKTGSETIRSRDPAGNCDWQDAIFRQPRQGNAIPGNAESCENRGEIIWNIVGFAALSPAFSFRVSRLGGGSKRKGLT